MAHGSSAFTVLSVRVRMIECNASAVFVFVVWDVLQCISVINSSSTKSTTKSIQFPVNFWLTIHTSVTLETYRDIDIVAKVSNIF